ncbi:hypothetical protein RRG08_041926 [Elysia crispata]|uniref:Uncharacterized protein n=1 Tax=Elysia crispata TaxID=231223 RepID=A0AAE1CNK1_9GAST|nr:hypothetical protein RRG08_041926 [Elysia crispata]
MDGAMERNLLAKDYALTRSNGEGQVGNGPKNGSHSGKELSISGARPSRPARLSVEGSSALTTVKDTAQSISQPRWIRYCSQSFLDSVIFTHPSAFTYSVPHSFCIVFVTFNYAGRVLYDSSGHTTLKSARLVLKEPKVQITDLSFHASLANVKLALSNTIINKSKEKLRVSTHQAGTQTLSTGRLREGKSSDIPAYPVKKLVLHLPRPPLPTAAAAK